jgi:catechol 2,3-dioxygenase-like lactoylglutathione lyase family enzyme
MTEMVMDHAPASRALISQIAAKLFVSDIKATCDFFTQKLGFAVVFTYGDPPFYAQVMRDRALLNFKCVDYTVIEPALRDRECLLSADIGVDTREDIERLFAEFQMAGVGFFQALRKEPWGALTLIVKDPDGNLLLFAGPAE